MPNPAERKPTVFVSHASADADAALLMTMQLEAEGISCWLAPRDIPPGQRYAEAIYEGIDACTVFLVLFSARATESSHVANEIEEGAGKRKTMLVVRTDATDPAENHSIRLFLRSHQWFDASDGPLSRHTDRLARDIKSLLDQATLETLHQEDRHPEFSAPTSSRPTTVTALYEPTAAPAGPLSIGIEIGATKIRGCVVDLGDPDSLNPTVEEYEQLTPTADSARAILNETKALIARIIAERFPETPPVGIGIAASGQVDLRAGTLKFGPHLFGARNVPFKNYLAGAFPRIPIRVDNDVRCATRCELHLGMGREFDSFACIFVGAGVGSGTVIDRRIHFGHNFCAGEIGHTKVAPSGSPCACGQTGCLETFVKAQAIIDRAHAKVIDYAGRGLETVMSDQADALTTEFIVQAIEDGDDAAAEVASEVGAHLGLGIANYLNLVNPAAIVIGGAMMSGFFFHMIEEISNAVQKNSLAEVANTPIVQSSRAAFGIPTGAALLFHEADGWPFR